MFGTPIPLNPSPNTAEEILEQARRAVYNHVLEAPSQREANKVSDTLKLSKGACEVARKHIKRSRKPRMRTIEYYLCDSCDDPISKPTDGFVIHGNIYMADPSTVGGLVGDNFPDSEEPFTEDNVTKTVLCRKCFSKILKISTLPQSVEVRF